MKISLIFTGKTQPAYLRDGVEMYLKRIKNYVPAEVKICGEKKGAGKKRSKKGVADDIEKVLAGCSDNSFIILLDEKGISLSSLKFAGFMQKTMVRGYKEVIFIAGGPYGFPDSLYKLADKVISLSDMTLSHQMVRLLLVEQIYRAMTIIRGEPYHHE